MTNEETMGTELAALPEMPIATDAWMDTPECAELGVILDQIRAFGERSTANRSYLVTNLYGELEDQLKKFYACREMSLAVTNLQQSRLWRSEAGRLWADVEKTPPSP